jgi:hypothetical protein
MAYMDAPVVLGWFVGLVQGYTSEIEAGIVAF